MKTRIVTSLNVDLSCVLTACAGRCRRFARGDCSRVFLRHYLGCTPNSSGGMGANGGSRAVAAQPTWARLASGEHAPGKVPALLWDGHGHCDTWVERRRDEGEDEVEIEVLRPWKRLTCLSGIIQNITNTASLAIRALRSEHACMNRRYSESDEMGVVMAKVTSTSNMRCQLPGSLA